MVHKDFYIITLETTYWVQRHHYESSDHYVDDLLEEIKVSRKKDDKDFILIATINWEYFLLNDIKIWKELFDSFNKKDRHFFIDHRDPLHQLFHMADMA